MKHLLQPIIVAAGLLAGTAAHAGVIVYDVTADFHLTKNASSPWSYGYSPGARANYHFTEFDTVNNAYSTPNWTPIPRQTGHRFHGKLDTHSSANWTLIPLQTGQFEAV